MKLSERSTVGGGPLGADYFHFIRDTGGGSFASYKAQLSEIVDLAAQKRHGMTHRIAVVVIRHADAGLAGESGRGTGQQDQRDQRRQEPRPEGTVLP